jgi:hypothetical protein
MVADLYPHRPESYSWPMEGVHCLPHQHSLLPMEDGRYLRPRHDLDSSMEAVHCPPRQHRLLPMEDGRYLRPQLGRASSTVAVHSQLRQLHKFK